MRLFCKITLSAALLLTSLCGMAQEFPKVILRGDYADPTILRDGNDYYMTHSPFYYAPGFLIWHSQDLQHWEPVCRALPEINGSAWAPDLVKVDGRYYIYYPANGTNYVIFADDIRGPWSKAIDLKTDGIDPGHLLAADGKRYLYFSGGAVQQLADDGLSVVGEKKWVYQGWQYPEEWETECTCLESPKMTYKDGYYYLTAAQGGTAGPATSHMAVSARAKDPMGPWENSPYNPIVHTYSAGEGWWSKGHGTIVDDVNGQWWIVYHAYERGFHTLGRETLIEPLEWDAEGWFHVKPTAEFPEAQQDIKHGLTLSDDFQSTELGMQWSFWNENASSLITLGKGHLLMPAKGDKPANARLLQILAEDRSYQTEVTVNITDGNDAGLLLFYNEEAHAGVMVEDGNFVIYKNKYEQQTVSNGCSGGGKVTLRLTNSCNRLKIEASKNGKQWTTLAADVDVSKMHHNNYGGFMSLKVALASAGSGTADFSHFVYRSLE